MPRLREAVRGRGRLEAHAKTGTEEAHEEVFKSTMSVHGHRMVERVLPPVARWAGDGAVRQEKTRTHVDKERAPMAPP